MNDLQMDTISDAEKYLHSLDADMSSSFFSKFDHRCYFCDFQDFKYLEKHHLDGNHSNNNDANLVAACTLCHRIHHLSWCLVDKAAVLGVCHDLDQVQINHLVRFTLVLAQHPDKEINRYFKPGGIFASLLDNLAMQFSRPNIDTEQVRNSVFTEYPEAEKDVKEALIDDRINAAYVRQSLASNDGLERLINAIKLIKGNGKKIQKGALFPFVLLFTENILSQQQIQYYLSLDEFNTTKWTQIYEQKLLAGLRR